MLKSDEPTVVKELEQLGTMEVCRRLARGEYGDIGSDLQLFVERWVGSNMVSYAAYPFIYRRMGQPFGVCSCGLDGFCFIETNIPTSAPVIRAVQHALQTDRLTAPG
jgi:hypothetical protein